MAHYQEQDGLKYYFEQRFEKRDCVEGEVKEIIEFPTNAEDLVENYINLERVLNKDWHKDTNLGAAVSGDGLLTDHGVGHINDVMAHAAMILGKNIKKMYGYEIYLLMLAIHFHDLGNIEGREDHEEKILEIMQKMGEALPLDLVEKQFIAAIASAHGGYADGDKDTIYYINMGDSCNGVKARPRLLAAILRFADELSDDFNRVNYKGIAVPDGNRVYHEYSKCLEPVRIEGETVSFHYRIPYELTQNKVGKGNKKVFLYDEILERLAKTMRELEYCRIYANGFIKITTLNVTIDVMEKNNLLKCKENIGFRLTIKGYPNEKERKIYSYMDYSITDSGRKPGDDEMKYRNGTALKNAMKEVGKRVK